MAMNDPITPGDLSAFADGELDSTATMHLLEQMAKDPTLAQKALEAQRLKQAIGRSMQRIVPAPPAELRQHLEQMMLEADHPDQASGSTRLTFPSSESPAPSKASGSPSPRSGSVLEGRLLGLMGRWSPAAAAAVLLLAAVLTRLLPASSAEVFDPDRHVAYPGIIPVSQVDQFMGRHVRCMDQIEPLRESNKFPLQVEQLPSTIEKVIGCKPLSPLDLSALGYTFWKAGECGIPRKKAVHLIYRALPDTGRQDSLSLWMVRDQGQLDIPERQTCLATPENAVHPVIVWRDGGLVYYLVGDAEPLVRTVADSLASATRP